MGTLAWLSQPPQTPGQYLRGGANFVIGIGLCLLSLLQLTTAVADYTSSPWVLPTLCLSLFTGKSSICTMFTLNIENSNLTDNFFLFAVVVMNHIGHSSEGKGTH